MASHTRQTARVARALGDETRLKLLRIIARGEVSCRELTRRVGLAQATVSHHLKVLAEAGLVAARRQGPFHWYRPVFETFAAAASLSGAACRSSRPPRATL